MISRVTSSFVVALAFGASFGTVGCGASDSDGPAAASGGAGATPGAMAPVTGGATGNPLAPGSGGSTGTPGDPTTPVPTGTPGDPTTPVPTGTPGDPTTPVPTGTADPGTPPVTASCNIHSGFAGDELCIVAPPADQGFQIHYGPSDYDDPAEMAKYTLAPGGETNVYVPATTGNATDVYFYKRQYRMRHGSHHLIITEAGGGTGIAGTGRRLGGSQNPIKDNPEGATPPENQGIGMPLKANTALSLNLHHYNGTDEPILKEAWVNFWYVDPATVTKQASEMFLLAAGQTIPVNAHVTVTGTRNVTTDGRILTMYGHRHSNNVRFSAYRTRGTDKMLVYEDYNWEEPQVLEFNSLTTNVAPNQAAKTPGGFSGILDVKAGDKIGWECEIQNKSGATIIFNQNEAITSEMCILIGDTVDTAISPF